MHHSQTRGHKHGGGLAHTRQPRQNFLVTNIINVAGGVNGFFVDGRGHHGRQLSLQTLIGRPLHGAYSDVAATGLNLSKTKVVRFRYAQIQQVPAGRGFLSAVDRVQRGQLHRHTLGPFL